MSKTTVHRKPDIHTGPLLVVRTRFLDDGTEDLSDTIIGALANQTQPGQETFRPELVVQALEIDELDDAESLAKTMREAHSKDIPARQRVKVVRLTDATPAEIAAIEPDTTVAGVQ